MTTATIRLELLRSGPSHNQLLSPLTPYVAVCGNRPAETVHLASEHLDTLERLDRLRYERGVCATDGEIRAAAEPVTRLLSSIAGLREEIAVAQHAGASLVHVRLILSAQELALLPFELAQAPTELGGLPLLGFALPACVVMTRETRREARPVNAWPAKPRILVITADPLRQGIPRTPHLIALRAALAPWLDRPEPARTATPGGGPNAREYDELVEILDEATLPRIAERCAAVAFTHVHILCHGMRSSQREPTFGLALHDPTDPSRAQWVDGTRLASAVMSGVGTVKRQAPSVLTLAVCDAGNVETVVRPNASVAHALHAAGIPLVVASQLPLTFEGSTRLTRTLYTALLAGTSPTQVLADARADLLRSLPRTQDWAALTSYSRLPDDFERCLLDARAEALKMQVELALETLDRFGLEMEPGRGSREDVVARGRQLLGDSEVARAYRAKLDEAAQAARAIGPSALMRYVSSYKRVAALGISYDGTAASAPLDRATRADAVRIALLRKALGVAEEIFAATRSGWSATQRVSLHAALTSLGADADTEDAARTWRGARYLVEEERRALLRNARLDGLDGRAMALVDNDALEAQLWVCAPAAEISEDEASPMEASIGRITAQLGDEPDLRATRGFALLREMHRVAGWWFAAKVPEDGETASVYEETRARARVVIDVLERAGVLRRYRPLRLR